MRVLDFGCGDGGFDEISPDRLHTGSWIAQQTHYEAWGIDINPIKIGRAISKVRCANFRCMDGCHTYFYDGTFDVVHCWGALHHIKDYPQAVKEIARIIKPGGILQLTESVDNDLAFRLVRRLWDNWQGDKVQGYFTTGTLRGLLQPHFKIITEKYYHRLLLSDVLRSCHKEPDISLRLNKRLSDLFGKLGIAEKMCCHYSILAIRRD